MGKMERLLACITIFYFSSYTLKLVSYSTERVIIYYICMTFCHIFHPFIIIMIEGVQSGQPVRLSEVSVNSL